jgi:hypothetical protein
MPTPPGEVQLISYADDTTLAASGPHVKPICDTLNGYIPTLLAFLEERQLMVSAEKSTVTLFTPDSREVNKERFRPKVYVNGAEVPLVKNPKILGELFDPMFIHTAHRNYAVERARGRINVLKALAGTSWGQDKDTLLLTYKSVVRPVAEYGAPIWCPGLSHTGWQRLEAVQNYALRVATGCHRNTKPVHLRQETKVLPLQTHAEMISAQYLAGCHRHNHLNRDIVLEPEPPRDMKETVASRFGNKVNNLLPQQVITDIEYRSVIKQIHTETVQTTINSYEPNRVLGYRAQEVDRSASCIFSSFR